MASRYDGYDGYGYDSGRGDRYGNRRHEDAADDRYEEYEDTGYGNGEYDDGAPYDDRRGDEYPEDDRYDSYDRYDDENDADGWYEEEYIDDRYDEPERGRAARRSASPGNRSGHSGGSRRSGSKKGNQSRSKGSAGKKRRKKKGVSPVLILVLLILILGGAFGGKLYLDKYSYSNETADLEAEFGITDDGDVAIVWGNELSEIRARLIDGVYYMSLDNVKEYLNDRFYYGLSDYSDTTGMIIYCLPTEKISVTIGSNVVSADASGDMALDYVPALNVDGTIYLALEFVQQYTNFTMTAFTEPNRLQIDTEWGEETTATVKRKTQVRVSGGIKSEILAELAKGDTVTILEEMDTWSKVKTSDSIIGYVENKRLTDITTGTASAAVVYEEPEYTHITFEGKINMAFHNVWGTQGNWTLTSYLSETQDVNIIAPTWYWVSDDYGNLDKAGELDYVETAHSMGLEVWAVVDNINSSTLDDNHSFLTTLQTRTNLIEQLIAEADTYGFDGINVDFELIPEENGEDYIEFIRELSIACRAAGITLSVDNYPAYSYNYYYDLEEQGVWVDYVIVMGYDEHYAGSSEAGSVSSISYVDEGIQMALEVVDADRVINAIPFYSRIWKTTDGVVTSEAYGMSDIQEYITNHNMTVSWDASTGQYYAETTEDGTLIQIWVEDAESIRQKLDVMQAYGVKGVAEWRLQFETSDVWDVISDYMAQ